MNKHDKILIYTLLIIIIIGSIIMIYKIKTKPKYDEKLYKEIYTEYEDIIENRIDADVNIESINNTNIKNDNNVYIIENATGYSYKVVATIKISKINIAYPIISEATEEYLKIAPAKLYGAGPNQVGNFCIVGHNYRDNKQFSRLSVLEKGDIVELTDRKNNKLQYKVYDKYEIEATDLSCTSQETNGQIELTLITCTNSGRNKRLVVKCISI